MGVNGLNKTVVISSNSVWSIINFWSKLAKDLMHEGYEIVALAPADGSESQLKALGIRFVPVTIRAQGTNPFSELATIFSYWRILRELRPKVFLGFTIKPNVYGSLAAGFLGIPVVNNITGLGSTFITQNFTNRIVRFLYRLALRSSHRVFFLNPDDLHVFVSNGLTKPAQSKLVSGSGVDLLKFPYIQRPEKLAKRVFLFIGRLLKDKGVMEFVEAAKIVKSKYPDTEFQLLGPAAVANPTAISRSQVDEWVSQNIVIYFGSTDNVQPYIANADCIVLPSYREGVPTSLLEASATGRPIVATDVPGCREVVEHGVTGLLCTVRDAESLAQCFITLIEMSDKERAQMGRNGRQKMEMQFDSGLVTKAYRDELRLI
jgi:glycosyltransferase involved in cell wall biosynthesis